MEIPSWMDATSQASSLSSATSTSAAKPMHPHQVQFYNDDYHLFNTISNYLSPLFDESYEDGTSAIIIARPSPIQYLKDQFTDRGYNSEFGDTNQHRSNELLNLVDVSTKKERHVLFIDAYQFLGHLTSGDGINSRDFYQMMNEVLSLLPGSEKRDGHPQPLLYAYGELVDILCERQQHWIAFELEELWNNLLAARNFSLLCGYKMDSFQDEGVADVFQHICHSHTNVSPTESYSGLETVAEKQTMVAALQQNVTALAAATKRQYDSFKQQRQRQEQFVELLSHELLNPVSYIAGNVELLTSGLETRNAILDTVIRGRGAAKPSDVATITTQLMDDAESVDAIGTSAAHMKTMADGLLSLSREHVPALQPIPHPTPIAHRITPFLSTIRNSSPSTAKHVLLVDNDLISSRVQVRLLEAASISVTTVPNGYEAIGKLINLSQSEKPVDVVLIELDIPFMDGVSTARAIRQLDNSGNSPTPLVTLSDVVIIGMTTHIRGEKYVDAGLAGIDDCVEKPISREMLLNLINAIHDLKLRGQ